MAFLELHNYSSCLGVGVSVNVIIPQRNRNNELPKVLYLLHGLSDDHTMWTRQTSIERYADRYNLAVVMPAVGRSFYCDQKNGYPYFTYVSEELPSLIHTLFRVAEGRENTFVAGLSMGGYGAFKLALAKPENYSMAASFSGCLDIHTEGYAEGSENRRNFGEKPEGIDDMSALLEKTAGSPVRPRLYQACGTNDPLYAQNQRFKAHAEALGYDLTYSEEPDDHNWGYWDKQIREALSWIFEK